jgi:hypothetical protein
MHQNTLDLRFSVSCLAVMMMYSSLGVSASAQNSSCQSTLAYLNTRIPTTGYQQLDTLRMKILATSVIEAMATMKAQGMSLDQGIDLSVKQADADEANLLSIERTIRGSAQNGRADSLMRGLKSRDYSKAGFQEDVLGAAERAYVADDWGALANRETAKQFECFRLGVDAPSQRAATPTAISENTQNSCSELADHAPYPDSVADSQTLDESMNSIRQMLESTPLVVNRTTQSGVLYTETYLQNKVKVDPSHCMLHYHEERGINQGSIAEAPFFKQNSRVELGKVSNIEVSSNLVRQRNKASDTTMDPGIYSVYFRSLDDRGKGHGFEFFDSTIANRFAATLSRASQLCKSQK